MSAGTGRKLILFAGSSWLRIVITFGVSFFLTPMLIGQFGVDLFGLLSLVLLTLAVADPLKAAVGKVLTRELAQAKAAQDPDRLRKVFSNGSVLALLFGTAAGALLASIVVFAPALLQFAPENLVRVRTALAMESLIVLLTLLLVPLNNLYLATHRVVIENAHRSVARALDLVAAIVVFAVAPADAFIAYVVLRAVLRIVHMVQKTLWIRAKEPAARFRLSLVQGRVLRELAGVGAWSISGQIARIGFFASDQLFLNHYFGLAYNGLYGVINQLRAYARIFGGNISLGVDAVSADIHERGDDEKGRRVMLATMKLAMAVTLFCSVLVGVFAGPFIDVWLGDRLRRDERLLEFMNYQDAVTLIWSFILILLPGVVLSETHMAAANNLYGMGHIKRYSPAMLAAAGFKIALAWVLLALGGGPLVLAVSTLAANVAVYGLYFPVLICRLTGTTAGRLVREAYARPIVANAPLAVVGWLLLRGVTTWNWGTLIACVAALCLLFAGVFWTIIATRSERKQLERMFSGALRRFGLRPRPAP